MEGFTFRSMPIWFVLVLGLVVSTVAQTITPANWTSDTAILENDNTTTLWFSTSGEENLVQIGPVLGLTIEARSQVPSGGLYGVTLFTDSTTKEQDFQQDDFAFISCDPSTGFLPTSSIFNSAALSNVIGIVLYSQTADYCSLQDYSGSQVYVFTMKSQPATAKLLRYTQMAEGMSVAIRSMNSSQSSTGNGNNNNDQDSPLGPSPSTAVAMIILYSITGFITVLFLAIVITGAMRAHRHPERYGPSNVLGRPRQSRARGLARAMLETLPIVKFGQNEEPKPADIELGETNTQSTSRPETGEQDAPATDGQASDDAQTPHVHFANESGIAAAASAKATFSGADNAKHEGCSICTEDFEAGQDQRVLPCDHRFHPDCIDPWLLNVSGTCPLCRIDLRPTTTNTSEGGNVDEHGNAVVQEGQANPPPLYNQEGSGDRRSISTALLDRMGISRPDRLSQEERVTALRSLRGHRLARASRSEAGAEPAIAESAEEESSTRRRLRRVFGVRTRRTNEHGQPMEEAEESEPRS